MCEQRRAFAADRTPGSLTNVNKIRQPLFGGVCTAINLFLSVCVGAWETTGRDILFTIKHEFIREGNTLRSFELSAADLGNRNSAVMRYFLHALPVCVRVSVCAEHHWNWRWCWWKAHSAPSLTVVTRDRQRAICCMSDSDVLTWPTGQAWLPALAFLSGTALVTSHPAAWSATFYMGSLRQRVWVSQRNMNLNYWPALLAKYCKKSTTDTRFYWFCP